LRGISCLLMRISQIGTVAPVFESPHRICSTSAASSR